MALRARIRLDQHLVEQRLFPTRSKAADAIKRGHVTINGTKAEKPGHRVDAQWPIEISDPARVYVSRAALKLIAALDHFNIDVAGKIAADIGASTGGFTQVLLERDVARVYAIDVGHGQLAGKIESNARVVPHEGLNARHVTLEHIPDPLDLIVSDVSFISLKLALPATLALAKPGANLIALIKPQFEVGRKGLGKGGIVRDDDLRLGAVEGIKNWLIQDMNWQVMGIKPSPVQGSDGNEEFLIHACKK